MKTDTLKQIQERMAALKDKRRAELAMVQKKRAEAQEDAAKAERDLASAMEALDDAKFGKASQAQQQAQIKLEMFSRRLDQLAGAHLLAEEESDAAIDSLKVFADDLTGEFRESIAGPLRKLDALCAEYRAQIRAVNDTLSEWTRDIHPNFRSFGRSMYRDEAGNMTDRSPNPLPVQVSICPEVRQITSLLEGISRLDPGRSQETDQ